MGLFGSGEEGEREDIIKQDLKLNYDIVYVVLDDGFNKGSKFGVYNVYVEYFKASLPYWDELKRIVDDETVGEVKVDGNVYYNGRVWFYSSKEDNIIKKRMGELNSDEFLKNVIGGYGVINGELKEFDNPIQSRNKDKK